MVGYNSPRENQLNSVVRVSLPHGRYVYQVGHKPELLILLIVDHCIYWETIYITSRPARSPNQRDDT